MSSSCSGKEGDEESRNSRREVAADAEVETASPAPDEAPTPEEADASAAVTTSEVACPFPTALRKPASVTKARDARRATLWVTSLDFLDFRFFLPILFQVCD